MTKLAGLLQLAFPNAIFMHMALGVTCVTILYRADWHPSALIYVVSIDYMNILFKSEDSCDGSVIRHAKTPFNAELIIAA